MSLSSERFVICKVCLCALHKNEQRKRDIPGVGVNTKIYLNSN